MRPGGYESSDRPVGDLTPPPPGRPGIVRGAEDVAVSWEPREQCSPPEPGDIVWQYGVRHDLMPDGSLRETVLFDERPRPSLAERLIGAIFCPACLCLRIHPTHLLVCPEHRRKAIHRARERR